MNKKIISYYSLFHKSQLNVICINCDIFVKMILFNSVQLYIIYAINNII